MDTSGRNNWTRDEHIIAFNLYCQIPFGTIHTRNPKVIELARLLGRSVGSVSYKLANFARLDPTLHKRGIRGLPHGAKGEEEVWRDFSAHPEELAFESQRLVAERLGKTVEETAGVDTEDLPPSGVEREAIVRLRVNQSFFRARVLSAYNFRCCVTGLTITPLLVASHIVPWAEDAENRLNPRNGLCLNALHDRAFDRGLMWVEDGFIIHFSTALKEASGDSKLTVAWLTGFEGKQLLLPKNFSPDAALLRRHAGRPRVE
ncbi:MAG: HNH endonuclease [Acidobacteriota bacterium]